MALAFWKSATCARARSMKSSNCLLAPGLRMCTAAVSGAYAPQSAGMSSFQKKRLLVA
jgi:hypothetical protein